MGETNKVNGAEVTEEYISAKERKRRQKVADKEAKRQEKIRLKEEKRRLKEEKKEAKRKKKQKPPRTANPDIRLTNAKVIFRAAAIFLMVVFSLLGLYFVVNYEDSSSIIKKMNEYQTTLSEQNMTETAAETFAESFAIAYYTHDADSTKYSMKVSPYLASGLTLEAPTANVSSVVMAGASDITKSNDHGGYDVSVRMVVDYTVPLTEEEKSLLPRGSEQKTKVVRKSHMTVIPLTMSNGSYAVVSMPYFKADSNNAQTIQYISTLKGNADDMLQRDITDLAKNFLTAYCGDDVSQLKYFATEDFPQYVLGGEFSFGGISQIYVYEGIEEVYADVTYTVTSDGISQKQRVFLTMVKLDKYYVSELTTR